MSALKRLFHKKQEKKVVQKASYSSLVSSISESRSLGLAVLAEGVDAVVDIVAIHGLNGHREISWTAQNAVMWLKDLLPHDVPNARIMSWGYNADVFDKEGNGLDQQRVYHHAASLVSELALHRQMTDTERRPILFIAHSLGGIILKAALIHSSSCNSATLAHHQSILVSTHGIIYMGVPHQGSTSAPLGSQLVNIATTFLKADARILKELKADSTLLNLLVQQYAPISRDIVTKYAYETHETGTVWGTSVVVVPRSSAVDSNTVDSEPIAIHSDHRNMVRFLTRNDGSYIKIAGALQLMIREAPHAVAKRWVVHEEQQERPPVPLHDL